MRVLVVDDDDDLREALCDALIDQGYEAIEAADGVEALAKLRQHVADIIILDLMMPNMNGWELRAEMASDPSFAAIPVVVMTARAHIARKDELAADEYLQKPVSLAVLFDTLEELRRRGLSI